MSGTQLMDTSQLAVSVVEERGLILLNFSWPDGERLRWLWESEDGSPLYEIAEWYNADRLFYQIDRLWSVGVLTHATAAGARSLVMWERDKCRMREARLIHEQATKGLWAKLKACFMAK